ncbi:MAG: SHOCT-like domain-containing protein [Thermoanaerobacteraceae bacterium]
MQDEKLSILKMLEEGKITTDEAYELLEALKEDSSTNLDSKVSQKFRVLKIKISDTVNNKVKVNLSIPYSLVTLGMKIGNKFLPKEVLEGVDLEEVLKAINQGETGKIIDVYDDNDHVEISLE